MIPYQLNPISFNFDNPLTLIAMQSNSSVALVSFGNPNVSGIQYRRNFANTWENYEIGTVIDLQNVNDYVQFQNTQSTLSLSRDDHVKFEMTGRIEASGNIQSMLNYSTSCNEYCYCRLFCDCTSLITAKFLELPANILAEHCYREMFDYCSSLVYAPEELPAMNLAYCCYDLMFGVCTSLISIPKILPATTLAIRCYESMFYQCSSLTYIPRLPATVPARSCYNSMFKGCTSLIGQARIFLKQLKPYCMYKMFEDCSSLNYICVNFSSWDAIRDEGDPQHINDPTTDWLKNVAENGTFIKTEELEDIRGNSNIPENWSNINNVPYFCKLNYLTTGKFLGLNKNPYIDTGYIPSFDGFRIESVVDTVHKSPGDSYFYGIRHTIDDNTRYGVSLASGSAKTNIFSYVGSQLTFCPLESIQNNIKVVVEYTKIDENKYNAIITANGVSSRLNTTVTKKDLDTRGHSIPLFKVDIYDVSEEKYEFVKSYHPSDTIRIRNFKIFNALNECVIDLIPVLDRNTNVCMYDQVSERFLYNQGGSNFEYE